MYNWRVSNLMLAIDLPQSYRCTSWLARLQVGNLLVQWPSDRCVGARPGCMQRIARLPRFSHSGSHCWLSARSTPQKELATLLVISAQVGTNGLPPVAQTAANHWVLQYQNIIRGIPPTHQPCSRYPHWCSWFNTHLCSIHLFWTIQLWLGRRRDAKLLVRSCFFQTTCDILIWLASAKYLVFHDFDEDDDNDDDSLGAVWVIMNKNTLKLYEWTKKRITKSPSTELLRVFRPPISRQLFAGF